MVSRSVVNRVLVEFDELRLRYKKLLDFVHSPRFDNVSDVQQHLLRLQVDSMRFYLHVLSLRLSSFDDEDIDEES